MRGTNCFPVMMNAILQCYPQVISSYLKDDRKISQDLKCQKAMGPLNLFDVTFLSCQQQFVWFKVTITQAINGGT